jgi:hypothetical protein
LVLWRREKHIAQMSKINQTSQRPVSNMWLGTESVAVVALAVVGFA